MEKIQIKIDTIKSFIILVDRKKIQALFIISKQILSNIFGKLIKLKL
jgi:hypothetical protein